MKGRDGRFWLLIALMLAAALCCLPLLPAVIPVQWNDSGVSGWASRLLLLAFPALAAGFHLLRRARLSPGSQRGMGPSWGAALLLFGGQLLLTGNGLELWEITRADSRLLLPLADLAVGSLLLWLGNGLPKTRRESGRGVKAPAALIDRENCATPSALGGVSGLPAAWPPSSPLCCPHPGTERSLWRPFWQLPFSPGCTAPFLKTNSINKSKYTNQGVVFPIAAGGIPGKAFSIPLRG